jgi:hypothetical protein
MRNLLVLIVGMGMVLQGGFAKAESQPEKEAATADVITEGAGPDKDPNSTENQDQLVQAESAPEDRSEPMTLENKPRDDEAINSFPVAPVILGAYGVVMIAVGAGFGWQADQEYKDYNTFENNHYPNATEDLADDIETHATVANVLIFTGLGVVVASVIWGVVEGVAKKKKRKKAAEARLSARWRPLLSPTHAGVTVDF